MVETEFKIVKKHTFYGELITLLFFFGHSAADHVVTHLIIIRNSLLTLVANKAKALKSSFNYLEKYKPITFKYYLIALSTNQPSFSSPFRDIDLQRSP